MPKSWYDLYSIKIDYENDTEEVIKQKELYKKICAHKKPLFFMYNYMHLKTNYDKYMANVELKSYSMFKMSYKDLLLKPYKTDDEQKFVKWAQDRMPLDMSNSVMNKVCWKIEDAINSLHQVSRNKFDFNMLKSGYNYSSVLFNKIKNEYSKYKKQIANFAKVKKSEYYMEEDSADDEGYEDVDQMREQFLEKCVEICPNEYELCDILIDLCYKSRNNKEIVWFICGDVIIKNLLKNNNDNMYFPKKVTSDEEFWCKGNRFVMEKISVGGDK